MSMDFSSWPREQEQAFVVFEQRSQESSRKAFSIGAVVAGIWLFLLVGIYFGVQPDQKDITKGMNMDNLSKKRKGAEAPAPKPAPAAAPAAPEAKPAEAKPAEAAAPAAPAAEEKKEEKK